MPPPSQTCCCVGVARFVYPAPLYPESFFSAADRLPEASPVGVELGTISNSACKRDPLRWVLSSRRRPPVEGAPNCVCFLGGRGGDGGGVCMCVCVGGAWVQRVYMECTCTVYTIQYTIVHELHAYMYTLNHIHVHTCTHTNTHIHQNHSSLGLQIWIPCQIVCLAFPQTRNHNC